MNGRSQYSEALKGEPAKREESVTAAAPPAQMGEKGLGQQRHRFHPLFLGDNSVLLDGSGVAVKPGLSDSGSLYAVIKIAVGRGVSAILTARKQVLHAWSEPGEEKATKTISPSEFSGLTHDDTLTFGRVVCAYDVTSSGRQLRVAASVACLRELPHVAHVERTSKHEMKGVCGWQESATSRQAGQQAAGSEYCDPSYICQSKGQDEDSLGMGAKEEAAKAVVDDLVADSVQVTSGGGEGAPRARDVHGDSERAEGKGEEISSSSAHCQGPTACKGCLECGFSESKGVIPVRRRDPNPGRCYDVPERWRVDRPSQELVHPAGPQALPEPVAMDTVDQDDRGLRGDGALFARQVSIEEGDEGDADHGADCEPEADGYAADNAEHGSEGCEDTIDDDSEGLGSRIVSKPASPAWIMPRSLRSDFLDGVLPSCAAADADYPSDVSLDTVVDVEESSDVDKAGNDEGHEGGSCNGRQSPRGTEASSSGDFVPGGDEEPRRSGPETSSNLAGASVDEGSGAEGPSQSAETGMSLPEASGSVAADRDPEEGDGSLPSVSGASPEWSCERCTLYNPSGSGKCNACGYIRLSKRRLRTHRARPERLEYERIPQKARICRRKREDKGTAEGTDDRNTRSKRQRGKPPKIRRVNEEEGDGRGDGEVRSHQRQRQRQRQQQQREKTDKARESTRTVGPGERCSSTERTADEGHSTTSDTNVDAGLPSDGESEDEGGSEQDRTGARNGTRSAGTESSVVRTGSSNDIAAAKRQRIETVIGDGAPDANSIAWDTRNNVVSPARSRIRRRVSMEATDGPESANDHAEQGDHQADNVSNNGGNSSRDDVNAVGVASEGPPGTSQEDQANEEAEVCLTTRLHRFDDVEVIELEDSSGNEACTETVNDDEPPPTETAAASGGARTSSYRREPSGGRNSTRTKSWSVETCEPSRGGKSVKPQSAKKRQPVSEERMDEGADAGGAERNGKVSEECEQEHGAGTMVLGRTNRNHDRHRPPHIATGPSGRTVEKEGGEQGHVTVSPLANGKAGGKQNASLGSIGRRDRTCDSPNGSEQSKEN